MPLITTASAASARGLGLFKQTGARTTPISGYELWLDSSDAATFTYSSGTVVSNWVDKSANAYAFQPSTTANAPTRSGTQNSKSTVVFDGSNDFLVSTAASSVWKFLSDGTQNTVIIVYKNTKVATGSSDDVVLLDTTGYEFNGLYAGYQGFTLTSQEWYYPALTTYYSNNKVNVNNGVIQSGQTYPANVVATAYLNSTYRNTWNVSLNLEDINNATDSSKLALYNTKASYPDIAATGNSYYGWTAGSTSSPASTLKIGWYRSGAYYPPFQGEIAEIIMYKRKLSVSEKSEMATYLKNKWNI